MGQNDGNNNDVFRIFQHQVQINQDGRQDVRITKKIKYNVPGLRKKHKNFEGIHSVAATKNQEFIILFDRKNACVIDFRNADKVVKGSEQVVTVNDMNKIYMHKNKFIKGI